MNARGFDVAWLNGLETNSRTQISDPRAWWWLPAVVMPMSAPCLLNSRRCGISDLK